MECENVAIGNVAWRVEGGWLAPLRANLFASVGALDAHAAARLIKRTVVRNVYRLELGDGREAIVKVYHQRGVRRRLKGLAFGPTPLREWKTSRRLVAMGLPASRAVAVGIPRGGSSGVEGYLVVEAAASAVELNEGVVALGLAKGWSAETATLVGKLGRMVRRLHDRGVWHRDLHCGNVLVRTDALGEECPFVVVDLHRMWVGPRPGVGHRLSSISLLLRTCLLWRKERQRLVEAFLGAYLVDGSARERAILCAEAIVAEADRQRRSRIRSRAKRCLRDSSRFAVEATEGWRVFHRRDCPLEAILALLGEPAVAALLDRRARLGVERVRRGRDGRVLEVRVYREGAAVGLLPLWVRRPPGVARYASAHRRAVESGGGSRAVAALVGIKGEMRGVSVSVVEA